MILYNSFVRETEWMFATDAGRRELSESAGFERLVVVCLGRNHTYKDKDSIQAELSSKVMELAPPSFKPGTKVIDLRLCMTSFFSMCHCNLMFFLNDLEIIVQNREIAQI